MSYDKNDPRHLIELEIIQVMQQNQIEYLLEHAVESEADFQAEIGQLKETINLLCNVLEPEIKSMSPALKREEVAEIIEQARKLVEGE